MAEEKKVVRSVRANPVAFDRLSTIAKESGLDQGAMLEALLNTWDVQAAKGQVPERAADVADFDAHLQGIQTAFLRSLELAQSAEARARVAYQAQLDAASTTIARLQADLTEAQAKLAAQAAALAETQAKLDERTAALAEAQRKDRLTSLLDSLMDKLDAPTLPEATRKRKGRKAEADAPTEAGNIDG